MQIDKVSFPVHTIDLVNAKVLIWPEQAKGIIRKKFDP